MDYWGGGGAKGMLAPSEIIGGEGGQRIHQRQVNSR